MSHAFDSVSKVHEIDIFLAIVTNAADVQNRSRLGIAHISEIGKESRFGWVPSE
jgi:hypothetical protein